MGWFGGSNPFTAVSNIWKYGSPVKPRTPVPTQIYFFMGPPEGGSTTWPEINQVYNFNEAIANFNCYTTDKDISDNTNGAFPKPGASPGSYAFVYVRFPKLFVKELTSSSGISAVTTSPLDNSGTTPTVSSATSRSIVRNSIQRPWIIPGCPGGLYYRANGSWHELLDTSGNHIKANAIQTLLVNIGEATDGVQSTDWSSWNTLAEASDADKIVLNYASGSAQDQSNFSVLNIDPSQGSDVLRKPAGLYVSRNQIYKELQNVATNSLVSGSTDSGFPGTMALEITTTLGNDNTPIGIASQVIACNKSMSNLLTDGSGASITDSDSTISLVADRFSDGTRYNKLTAMGNIMHTLQAEGLVIPIDFDGIKSTSKLSVNVQITIQLFNGGVRWVPTLRTHTFNLRTNAGGNGGSGKFGGTSGQTYYNIEWLIPQGQASSSSNLGTSQVCQSNPYLQLCSNTQYLCRLNGSCVKNTLDQYTTLSSEWDNLLKTAKKMTNIVLQNANTTISRINSFINTILFTAGHDISVTDESALRNFKVDLTQKINTIKGLQATFQSDFSNAGGTKYDSGNCFNNYTAQQLKDNTTALQAEVDGIKDTFTDLSKTVNGTGLSSILSAKGFDLSAALGAVQTFVQQLAASASNQAAASGNATQRANVPTLNDGDLSIPQATSGNSGVATQNNKSSGGFPVWAIGVIVAVVVLVAIGVGVGVYMNKK